jgi:hypothetical protein
MIHFNSQDPHLPILLRSLPVDVPLTVFVPDDVALLATYNNVSSGNPLVNITVSCRRPNIDREILWSSTARVARETNTAPTRIRDASDAVRWAQSLARMTQSAKKRGDFPDADILRLAIPCMVCVACALGVFFLEFCFLKKSK